MLPKLSDNMSQRNQSPRYVPAPWGDRELGELLDTGDSPTRRKRLKRKDERADLLIRKYATTEAHPAP